LCFQKIKVPIIAVTGSNGKTTTVTMMAKALESFDKKVFLGGNIGLSPCELLLSKEKVDYVVLELSSFQLESIDEFRPKVSVILNLFDNHGERYKEIIDYARAKFNITKNLKDEDVFIYQKGSMGISEWVKNGKYQKIEIPDQIEFKEAMPEIDLNQFLLPGIHNKMNLYFVYQIFKSIKLPLWPINQMIKNFRGVYHRIERLDYNKNNLMVFNDSKSTNWQATMTAVSAVLHFKKEIILNDSGEEITAMRFTLDKDGNYSNINDLQQSIVYKNE